MNSRYFAVLAVAATFSCGGIVARDGAPTGSDPAQEPDAGEPCHERAERGWAIVRAALDIAHFGCTADDECSVLPPVETNCPYVTCGEHVASDARRHLVDEAVQEANSIMCVDDPNCLVSIPPCKAPFPSQRLTRLACEGGDCLLVPECDASGCPYLVDGVPCCIPPDGECGADLGEGCVVDEG